MPSYRSHFITMFLDSIYIYRKNLYIASIKTKMNPDHLQQQQQTNNTKKKKCRGNRKRQRYRRQLYNQGLNKNEVNELVEKKFPSHILQQPQQQQQQQQDNGMIFEKHNLQNKEVSIPFNRVSSRAF